MRTRTSGRHADQGQEPRWTARRRHGGQHPDRRACNGLRRPSRVRFAGSAAPDSLPRPPQAVLYRDDGRGLDDQRRRRPGPGSRYGTGPTAGTAPPSLHPPVGSRPDPPSRPSVDPLTIGRSTPARTPAQDLEQVTGPPLIEAQTTDVPTAFTLDHGEHTLNVGADHVGSRTALAGRITVLVPETAGAMPERHLARRQFVAAHFAIEAEFLPRDRLNHRTSLRIHHIWVRDRPRKSHPEDIPGESSQESTSRAGTGHPDRAHPRPSALRPTGQAIRSYTVA